MSLARRSLHSIGVDLGGTNIVTALAKHGHGLLAKSKVATRVADGPTNVIRRMAQQIKWVATHSGLPKRAILGVGVGSPGPLDAWKGVVLKTPNLTGWHNVQLTKILSKATGYKVFLDNDANVAALGEHRQGAGKGCADMVMLTLGTGVGGGVILGGKLLVGADTTAGELGHFSIDPLGPPCGCGQRGCLEVFASATALARRGRELAVSPRAKVLRKLCGGNLRAISSAMVHQAMLARDPMARQAWQEYIKHLATGVIGYIHVFNPQCVVLGGGVMAAAKDLLPALRIQVLKHAFPSPARRAKIVAAALGDDSGVLGAAEMALDRMGIA